MPHNLSDTISLLTRTPASLDALLRDLPETWTSRNEGPNTWSAFDVVAHLIYGEQAVWIPHAKFLLQFGETRAFEPFDRQGHVRASQGKSLPKLLDDWLVHAQKVLANWGFEFAAGSLPAPRTPSRLRARHTPQHLATWAIHDLTHLHQISRIMAHQYREAVGPWRAYLGVLQCNGTPALIQNRVRLCEIFVPREGEPLQPAQKPTSRHSERSPRSEESLLWL